MESKHFRLEAANAELGFTVDPRTGQRAIKVETSITEKDSIVDGGVKRTNFRFDTPDGIDMNAYRWEKIACGEVADARGESRDGASSELAAENRGDVQSESAGEIGDNAQTGPAGEIRGDAQNEPAGEIGAKAQSEPTGDIRGIIQIAHGMAEHILRYDDFARHLVQQGFIVYGKDHRGHGGTIKAPDDKGFFANEDGFHKVVFDMKQLSAIIRAEHPDLPLFLLGHSLGSFLTRRYIQVFNNDLSGVILSGTGYDKGIGKIGLQLAKWEKWRKGPRMASPLMDKLVFYGFNENFEPAKTEFDYLTRDEEIVEKYVQDDKCGFVCATTFYIDLLKGLDMIHQKAEVLKTPRTLPILLISGDMDPVGEDGKGVKKVYQLYKRVGCKHVEMKLYPEGRHEMLNEINKDEVYADVLHWLETILKGGTS